MSLYPVEWRWSSCFEKKSTYIFYSWNVFLFTVHMLEMCMFNSTLNVTWYVTASFQWMFFLFPNLYITFYIYSTWMHLFPTVPSHWMGLRMYHDYRNMRNILEGWGHIDENSEKDWINDIGANNEIKSTSDLGFTKSNLYSLLPL